MAITALFAGCLMQRTAVTNLVAISLRGLADGEADFQRLQFSL
ncbi:hypothetical protein [Rhizobium cauense]|nr:hypothetical protein [Rhizobium cauense]